jgi:hypothetical protein
MPCFNPLVAFRAKYPNPASGKTPIVFSARDAGDPDDPVKLPCGQCIGCRLERSRQWAIRCVHEASLYERNCFITLTYAPEHLPKSGSLDKRDFQLFMKRLRKKYGSGVRYFHCGEYGQTCKVCGFSYKVCFQRCRKWDPRIGRPHYHACLFNFDFEDRDLWSVRNELPLYTSKALAELWPFGFSTIGDVTFESAAYVARYITKKVTGELADAHYEKASPSGEIFNVVPEYTTMSRRPGIGRGWLEKYTSDVYPHDRIILRGRALRPPKYYDSVFELDNPVAFDDVREARKLKAVVFAKDSSYKRLRVREQLQYLRFACLKRGLEYDL